MFNSEPTHSVIHAAFYESDRYLELLRHRVKDDPRYETYKKEVWSDIRIRFYGSPRRDILEFVVDVAKKVLRLKEHLDKTARSLHDGFEVTERLVRKLHISQIQGSHAHLRLKFRATNEPFPPYEPREDRLQAIRTVGSTLVSDPELVPYSALSALEMDWTEAAEQYAPKIAEPDDLIDFYRANPHSLARLREAHEEVGRRLESTSSDDITQRLAAQNKEIFGALELCRLVDSYYAAVEPDLKKKVRDDILSHPLTAALSLVDSPWAIQDIDISRIKGLALDYWAIQQSTVGVTLLAAETLKNARKWPSFEDAWGWMVDTEIAEFPKRRVLSETPLLVEYAAWCWSTEMLPAVYTELEAQAKVEVVRLPRGSVGSLESALKTAGWSKKKAKGEFEGVDTYAQFVKCRYEILKALGG